MAMTKQEYFKKKQDYRKANMIRKEVKFHKEGHKKELEWVQKILDQHRTNSFNSLVIGLINKEMYFEEQGITDRDLANLVKQKKENK